MYPVLLGIHSWVRWILLIGVIVLLIRSIAGYRKASPFTSLDDTLVAVVFWSLNVQFLLGVILFIFFSPATQVAFSNISEAMSDSSLRFFLIEHPFSMLLALGAGHSGIAKAKRAEDAKKKHGSIMKGIGACLLCILVGIPWPFLPYGRVLFFL